MVVAQTEGICDRTVEIQAAILEKIGGGVTCDTVTTAQLAELMELRVNDTEMMSLESGDLNDLVALTSLDLSNNKIKSVPDDMSRDLYGFDIEISLEGNQLTELSENVFKFEASNSPGSWTSLFLKKLNLRGNNLQSLEDGIFQDALFMTELDLSDNNLSDLPIELFPLNYQLGMLERLDLGGNSFPAGVLTKEVEPGNFDHLLGPLSNGDYPATLVHLGLDDVPLADDDLSKIRDNLNTLQSLDIANTGASASAILGVITNLDLKEFSISDTDLSSRTDEEVVAFMDFLGSQRPSLITRIEMARTQIDGETVLQILDKISQGSEAEPVGFAEELDFSGNDLSSLNDPDSQTRLTEALMKLTRLESLSFDDTGIDVQTALTVVENVAESITTISLVNNDQFSNEDLARLNAASGERAGLKVLLPEIISPTEEPEEDVEEPGEPLARVLRIEPRIQAVTVAAGDRVALDVMVYGRQDILDNELANRVSFEWSDVGSGGEFDGSGRQVLYTAPKSPGKYTVSVSIDQSQCYGLTSQCSTEFQIKVRRTAAAIDPAPEPRNPTGVIPSILSDSDGNQYEVFTPEGGGKFTGDSSNLTAGPGVVPNGEIVGLRISEGDAASNEGKTYQRYSLGGNWYTISAVDGSGVSVASYVLNNALEVCIPLPIELSSRISGLAIVAINLDDSLTILSSTVRISGSATNVCGNVSSVPATIAVGSTGSPAPLPTAVPEIEDETDPPDTGGVAPSSGALVWALMIGFVGAIAGLAVMRSRRRRTK